MTRKENGFMNEHDVYRKIKSFFGKNHAFDRIENSVSSGMPDICVFGEKTKFRDFWIEVKVAEKHQGGFYLRPAQVTWLKEAQSLGRNILLLCALIESEERRGVRLDEFVCGWRFSFSLPKNTRYIKGKASIDLMDLHSATSIEEVFLLLNNPSYDRKH